MFIVYPISDNINNLLVHLRSRLHESYAQRNKDDELANVVSDKRDHSKTLADICRRFWIQREALSGHNPPRRIAHARQGGSRRMNPSDELVR